LTFLAGNFVVELGSQSIIICKSEVLSAVSYKFETNTGKVEKSNELAETLEVKKDLIGIWRKKHNENIQILNS
jgi:hypothetical protein